MSRNYINKVLNLAEEIAYSDDSIVSKIIYKTETKNLTLFAVAPGQSIAEHVTPFDAMVQVFDGKAEIHIGEETHDVKAGQAVIMPANVPHALFAWDSGFKMLLTMMK